MFDRASLGAGDRIAGPAIVTQLDATTLVARGLAGGGAGQRRVAAAAGLTHTLFLFWRPATAIEILCGKTDLG